MKPTSSDLIVALILGAPTLLTGCDITIGGNQQTQTVAAPASTVTDRDVERKRTRPTRPPEAAGPTGPLGTSSVGPVEVGMTAGEVEQLFGPPDRKETVNFGGGEAPQVDWIWGFDHGDFRLQLETDQETSPDTSPRPGSLPRALGSQPATRSSRSGASTATSSRSR